MREDNKKDEEKTEPEKDPEQKVENSINVEEEESMEFDLPVKSFKKEKKFVPESDSDEKNTKEKDILGKRKRNSSAKKKPSPPVKDKNDDVVQDSAQGTPKNPKEKELLQSSLKRDRNNSTKMPRLKKGLSETSSFRYLKTSSDADMTQRCYFFSDRANICTSYNSFSFVFCQICNPNDLQVP